MRIIRPRGQGTLIALRREEPKEDSTIFRAEQSFGTSFGHVAAPLAPRAGWWEAASGEHFAQFFETDETLIAAAGNFAAEGLASQEVVIVITTEAHRLGVERHLVRRGIDVVGCARREEYVALDARALLDLILVDDWPRAKRFADHVESLFAAATRRAPRVRAFGEMVGVLWGEQRYAAAIRLEELWNELAERREFTLFCGYPMSTHATAPAEAVRRVCAQHARTVPAESYVALTNPIDRLAEICELQNRALSVERELRERKAAERLLARREQELAEKVRELAELDRRKDEYLAMLGHELRNPLAAIHNAAAVLAHEESSDRLEPARRALCEVLTRHARHMGRLLDDLLDVGRFTQGKIALRLESCELEQLVARALDISRDLIEERCHRFDVRLPDEPVRLLGDPARLVQVLCNLLDNAAKYTPPGGRIAIAASVVEGWLRIGITDTGMGIAAEFLPRVFEPFEQAEQALERAHGGLGIGLTLVRGIIELHGGSVEAASAGLGLGAEFIVQLPIRDFAPHTKSADSRAESAEPSRKRVLIVDDNRDAADSLALLLDLYGHEVRSIGDGGQSIEVAREFSPDLIVMDIGLPGLDGYAAARQLRACGCTARLTALTGYGRPEDRLRAEQAGFDDFLVKPVDPQELEQLLHEPRPRSPR